MNSFYEDIVLLASIKIQISLSLSIYRKNHILWHFYSLKQIMIFKEKVIIYKYYYCTCTIEAKYNDGKIVY